MKKIGELLKGKRSVSIGFTHISYSKRTKLMTITHNGNMGNSIERSVNPNLDLAKLPPVDVLKERYEVVSEVGNPDYSWKLVLKDYDFDESFLYHPGYVNPMENY